MRGGETLRKRVFILLKGEKILDTNYSYADATRSLMRSVCLEDREDWNIEEEHQARQEWEKQEHFEIVTEIKKCVS